MGEYDVVIGELGERVSALESSVHYGITPIAEEAHHAQNASYAADSYAVGGYGFADLKEILVMEVVEKIANTLAERLDNVPAKESLDLLCDLLEEIL